MKSPYLIQERMLLIISNSKECFYEKVFHSNRYRMFGSGSFRL